MDKIMTKVQKQDIDDFHKIELEKIISAVQSMYTIRVTAGSITVTVVLALLGSAFNTDFSFFLGGRATSYFAASGITLAFILFDLNIKTIMACHYLRCLELMKTFSVVDENAFSSIFAYSPKQRGFIFALLDSNFDKRFKKIKTIGIRFPSMIGFWLPLVSAIGDIILGSYFLFTQ